MLFVLQWTLTLSSSFFLSYNVSFHNLMCVMCNVHNKILLCPNMNLIYALKLNKKQMWFFLFFFFDNLVVGELVFGSPSQLWW
jgi:hypothetical protein